MGSASGEVTRILGELNAGDGSAAERLLPLVYDELRALAGSYFRQQPSGHTLQPTALVHEAYLKLAGSENVQWESRVHFMAVAAKAMRQVLMNHARGKATAKRGGGRQRITLDEGVTPAGNGERELDLLALDDALTQLQRQDARLGDIVVYRYFGGLTNEQTADLLGISARTVRREWSYARLWLYRMIEGEEAPQPVEGMGDDR